jgi:hypothetical protein
MNRSRADSSVSIWDPLDLRAAARPRFWALVLAIVSLTHGPTFVDSLRPAATEGVDFFQEWASAKNLLHGLPIYTDLEQTANLYLGYKRLPGEELLFTKNAHPPSSILLALPVTPLSYPDATLVWNVVSLVAFGITLWMIAHALLVAPPRWFVFPTIALLLLCNPLRQQVNQGQLNLLLLFLLTSGWVAERRGSERLAGLLFGTAAAIKLFPGFFLLYYMLRQRWTIVAYGIGTFVVVTAATVLVLGSETYVAYFRDVLPQVSTYRNGWINLSLAGFWTKWFEAGALSPMPLPPLPRLLAPLWSAPLLAKAGLVVSALAVLGVWARAVMRSRTTREIDLAFGLTLVTMVLLSPLSWDHYLLLLTLPVCQLWIGVSNWRRARMVLLVLLVCIWLNPITFWNLLIPPSYDSGSFAEKLRTLTAVSLQFFALAGIFALAVQLHRASTRAGSESA